MEGVAIAIAYLTFALTWFECAQYAHIVWWAFGRSGDRSCHGTLIQEWGDIGWWVIK